MPPHKARRKRKDPHYLNAEQVRLLFQKIPVGEAEAAVGLRLMYVTLLRVGEVCSLRVRDLDFAESRISIWQGKGGDRKVAMTPDLSEVLHRHVQGRKPDEYAVRRAPGKSFSRFAFDQRLQRYAGWAGLTREKVGFRVHCHTLRHSGAREYLRTGLLKLNDLQKVLGHSNISTTSIYSELASSEAEEKMKRGGITID